MSPLEGIQQQAAAHGDKVLYADGSSQADATAVAQASDVVIAFAADTEQDLLPQPVRPVAAVERVGDGPVGVSLDLGVDQEEGRAADSHAPDAEPHRDELAAVVRELDHGSHRHEL